MRESEKELSKVNGAGAVLSSTANRGRDCPGRANCRASESVQKRQGLRWKRAGERCRILEKRRFRRRIYPLSATAAQQAVAFSMGQAGSINAYLQTLRALGRGEGS